MATTKYTTVDGYIAGQPEEIREILELVRATIREAAPEAEEAISYGIPVYRLCGDLVFFAAAKKHFALHAAPVGHAAYTEELARYKQGRGSVQFPLHEPVPLDLIRRMVQTRVKENFEKKQDAKSDTSRARRSS